MKISFLIPAVVLYVVEVAFSNSLQVGTVLFTTTDLVKKCWTENDKSLLKARFIMQDVLPDPDCIDFSKPEASVVLLEYFHACYQIIGTSTYGKLQNLMYIALSDTLGGYLRAYVLPFARRAYYAGQLQYSEAKKLFQLYDDIRMFLKTSGIGWAQPVKVCYKKTHAKPLIITGGSLDACAQLYIIEDKSRLHCINSPNCRQKEESCKSPSQRKPRKCTCACHQCVCTKNKRNSFQNSSISDSTAHPCSSSDTFPSNFTKRCTCCRHEKTCEKPGGKRIVVPLPVLDDCVSPNTIAVPFKKRPLRNLSSRKSAFILEYYYVAVLKCFIAKGNTRTDIKNFNAQFYNWLVSQVYPHLSDERWYPGFGGVLRVMETIRKFGTETTVQDSGLRDIRFMFDQGVSFAMDDNLKMTGKETVREIGDDDCECCSSRHYITIIVLGFFIASLIFCTGGFFCMALSGRKPGSKGTGDKKKSQAPESDNFVNFQFLIKFFKKKTPAPAQDCAVQHVQVEDEEMYRKWRNAMQPETPSGRKDQAKKEIQFVGDSWDRKYRDLRRLVVTAQGDMAALGMVSNLGTIEGSHVPECEVQIPYAGMTRGAGDTSSTHMFWKKRAGRREKRSGRNKDCEKSKRGKISERDTTSTSDEDTSRQESSGGKDSYRKESSNSCSASMEDESKGSSRETRSSTSSYSGSSQQANTTSINYSFSEAQESMGESYTLVDESYTNESDY